MAASKKKKKSGFQPMERSFSSGTSWSYNDPFGNKPSGRYTPDPFGTNFGGGTRQKSFYDSWDEYDSDGNLKSSEDFYRNSNRSSWSYDGYGQTSYSASSRWSGRYSTYDSSYLDRLDGEELQNAKMKKELRTIGRSVNAIRSVSGKLKREQNLTVTWSANGYSQNNISGRSEIHLSPNPLMDSSTLKPDWSADQRRDVVIGEALTLVGQKRLCTPIVAKKIIEELDEDKKILSYERDYEDWDNPSKQATFKMLRRAIAGLLWKAIEQDAARAEVLKEYRGSRDYFSAAQVYYSDESLKESITKKIEEVLGWDNETEKMVGASITAAQMLAWNINHSLDPNKVIKDPQGVQWEGDFIDAAEEAMSSLAEAAKHPKTAERHKLTMEAAEILITLEPEIEAPLSGGGGCEEGENEDGDQEQQQHESKQKAENEKKIRERILEDLLSQQQNGEQETSFGDVSNKENISGEVRVEDIEDETSSGLTEASQFTEFSVAENLNQAKERLKEWAFRRLYLRDIPDYEEDRLQYLRDLMAEARTRLMRKLDPIAQRNYLPEHGRRTGRLTRSALWKATTSLSDNDRVFHRKVLQGIDRNMTIGILIDFSGSMGSCLTIAKALALLIKDSLSLFENVDVQIYGHHGGGVHNRNHHYGMNQIIQFMDDETLLYCAGGGGTNEGSAYARVAKEMMQQSSKSSRKVLFAIGDGATGRECIVNAVKLAQEVGIETVDIFMGGSPSNLPALQEEQESIYGKGQVACVTQKDVPSLGTVQEQVIRVIEPWLLRLLSKLQKQAMIA